MAVQSDKRLLVRELLEFGANPNSKTHCTIDGPVSLTPLHLAQSKEVHELLLKYGAEPSDCATAWYASRLRVVRHLEIWNSATPHGS
jgi:hypothetical protein